MTEERDPYRVLGVPFDASDDEIRKAYYAHARRAHPDVVGDGGLDDMRAINAAWALLKDPDRRAAHDRAHGRAPRGRDGGASSDGPSAGNPAGGRAAGQDFAGQPAWTGAAGPPPGRPWGPVLTFGIYAGWSLGEIARRDRGYLTWLREKPEGKAVRKEIDRILAMSAESAPPEPKKGSKRR